MLSLKQAAQPNPSYPALCRQDTTSPWSTDHGGNSLNSDTNASNKKYLKEIQEKRKEETFFFRKKKKKMKNIQKKKRNEQKKRKNEKIKKQEKDKKKSGEKRSWKKRKRGPKGVPPEMGPKTDFSQKNCQEKS